MHNTRVLILAAVCGLFPVGPTQPLSAQGTTQFKVQIPKKTGSFLPIGVVRAVVGLKDSVTAGTPISFTFTDQLGKSTTATCSPNCVFSPHLTPNTTSTPPPLAECSNTNIACFTDNENPSSGNDEIVLTTSSTPGDTNRYEIDFHLQSNHGTPANQNSCANAQQQDPNFYTVQITSASGNTIVGVCLESFDGVTTLGNNCSTGAIATREIPIPLDDPNDKVATVDTLTAPTFACNRDRPAVSVAMVLDKSGSMDITDSGSAQSRIQSLRSAVSNFLDDWTALPPVNGDQVGVVTFNQSHTQVAPLESLSATNVTNIKNALTATNAGGSTSIGEGLLNADTLLGAASGRRLFLLMSDGIQNTDHMVSVNGNLVQTNCQFDSTVCGMAVPTTPLTLPLETSTPPVPIYAVTIGPTVSAAINQQMATASGGFYLNAETNTTSMLNGFFVELLQNFVRFNSYETVRLISENAAPQSPYSATFPISSTSHDLVLSLMWPSRFGTLRVTLTPPGAGTSIVKESESGFISIAQPLPMSTPMDPPGDWKLLVEALNAPAGAASTNGSVPFDLHVMTDDAGIKTELSVVPDDYIPGSSIRLRAKVTHFGLPVLGLGSHASDKVKLDLIKPGQSIGDMLSDSSASTTPSGPDPQSAAEAKLANTVRTIPGALKQVSDSIQLFDDGKPEHGDDVANDGIYSALYPATLTGHYNFLFSVESTDPNSVRFSRQQLRTAYVRAVPDAGNTVFTSSIQRHDNGGLLSIVMTPRVKPGPGCAKNDPKCGRMGPGWANYFWFLAPGQTPVKPKDNLDGTYTATVNFTGSNPPPVSVHFENVIAVIGDSVPPGKLPQPLDSGNQLTMCCTQSGGRLALFLDAGANLLSLSGNSYTGFSMNSGLEYMAMNHLALDGIFGYHRLSNAFGSDPNIYQFSFNARSYLTNSPFRLFVNGGIGGYKFGGASTYFGWNVGGGLLFHFSKRLGAEADYNYHAINDPGSTTFSTFQLGLRFQF